MGEAREAEFRAIALARGEQARQKLRALGQQITEQPQTPLDIADCALLLAVLDDPTRDPAPYQAHLESVRAMAASAPVAPTPQQAARWLGDSLAGVQGYLGDNDTYDDLHNADLMMVIDRRRGLPVSLSIFYLHLGRACGWQMDGLAFPGHFLVRLGIEGQRQILDPFHGGRPVDAAGLRALLKAVEGPDAELNPHHYAPVTDLTVLLRLRNNLFSRHMQADRYDAAAHVIDSMLLLDPTDPTLWREAAVTRIKQGQLRHAISALETLIHLPTTSAPLKHEASTWLTRLLSRLH